MKSREKILEYIKKYISEHGYAPSRREIATAIGLYSMATVDFHMKKLFAEGKLETDLDTKCARAYRIGKGA